MTPSGSDAGRKAPAGDGDERLSALAGNAAAIAAVAGAVEGTLGPRGLNSMLVSRHGEVTITNDGSTILQQIEVSHPAARLLIATARAQDEQVGDGTTTATILAAALVSEGVKQVERGVPVTRVIEGMKVGLAAARQALQDAARPVTLDDPLLRQAALVAGRGEDDLADLVLQAARHLPEDKLRHDPAFRLGDRLVAIAGADNEVLDGLLIEKQRLNKQMPLWVEPARVLLLDDALEPEEIEQEALATEAGFQRYLDLQRDFLDQLGKLAELQVNCLMTQRGIAEAAEETLGDQGLLAVRRVTRRDLAAVARLTGARPLKRAALRRPVAELAPALGHAACVAEDERHGHLRLTGGGGEGTATIIVSAATAEVRQERLRIAEDAAAAVQAALRGGLLPGGGAAEIAALPAVRQARQSVAGMTAYGLDCVVEALKRPLTQIVANAGYNPLEKVEEVVSRAVPGGSLAVDCDTGEIADMLALGVVDAAPVKLHALQAAGEVAMAVLRIATVIRRRDDVGEGDGGNGEL